MHQRPEDFTAPRLSAAMNSRRVLVLDFVRDYLAKHGVSPSYSEIAAGVGADRMAVKRAIRALAEDGLILRTPGPRGLAMPGREAEAIRDLRAMGWTVNPLASVVTKETLLPPAALDYPGPVAGVGAEDGTIGADEASHGAGDGA